MTLISPLLPVEQGYTMSGGAAIAWDRWPCADAPPAVLVHGTSAHSGWWHHTATALARHFDLLAVNLAGHGDSGRRDQYSISSWADDVVSVIDDVYDRPVNLVGHSIGGIVAAEASVARPDIINSLVLVDSIVRENQTAGGALPTSVGQRIYGSLEEGLARYRLLPPQPVVSAEVLDYVARRSLRRTCSGWAWKVDGKIFGALGQPGLLRSLAEVPCPVSVIRGENSQLVQPDAAAVLAGLLERPVSQYDVPDAFHHVMLDQGARFSALLIQALNEVVSETA